MTYLERIETISRAMYPEEWKNQDALRKLEPALWSGEAETRRRAKMLEYARRADAACLKAIREPTEEMRDELFGEICSAFDADGGVRIGSSVKVWHAAHAAIPR